MKMMPFKLLKNKYEVISINARAGLWYTICSFIQKGIGFLTVPIFTRLLTTEQYGKVTIYYSWESVLVIFCTLNLFCGVFNNSMIKYEKSRNEFLSALQGLVTSISIFMCFIYILFRNSCNRFFELDSFLVIVMFGEILASSAVSFWSAKERFEFKYRKMVLVTISITFLAPIFSVISVLKVPAERGATARIVTSALVTIIICGIVYIYNFYKGKVFYKKDYWLYALKFNIPLIPHYLSTFILNQSDRIMISKIIGFSEAGIYGLSYNLAMILNILATSINNAFAPWLYQKMKKKDYIGIASVSDILFAFIALTLFFMIAFAPEVVRFLATDEYYEAIYIIPPLTVSIYFIFMYQIFANIEFYFEKNKFISYASLSGALLNIILNFYFINVFGYIAAAYTTLICYLIFGVAHYFFMKKTMDECIESEVSLFNPKIIFTIAILLMLGSFGMLLLYNNIIIRYLIIFAVIMILLFNNKKIISNIKMLKEEK